MKVGKIKVQFLPCHYAKYQSCNFLVVVLPIASVQFKVLIEHAKVVMSFDILVTQRPNILSRPINL